MSITLDVQVCSSHGRSDEGLHQGHRTPGPGARAAAFTPAQRRAAPGRAANPNPGNGAVFRGLFLFPVASGLDTKEEERPDATGRFVLVLSNSDEEEDECCASS